MPEDYARFFAEVFADEDANPRRMILRVKGGGISVGLSDGNPVFTKDGCAPAPAGYRRRWLAEHRAPRRLRETDFLWLTPTSGNRVKVRRATWWERRCA